MVDDRAAGVLGLMVVLPIGADMPVVNSMLNTMTGPIGRGGGSGVEQHRDDRGRYDRRRVRLGS